MRQFKKPTQFKVSTLIVVAYHFCVWITIYYNDGISFVWHAGKFVENIPIIMTILLIILELWWLANPAEHSTWRHWTWRLLIGTSLMIHVRRSPLTLALLCSLPIFDASLIEPFWSMLLIVIYQLFSSIMTVLWIRPVLFRLPWPESERAVFFVLIVLMVLIPLAMNRLRASLEEVEREMDAARRAATELAKANIRLQDYSIENEAFVLIRERLRMARDIHDTLGYTLTAAAREIEACEDLLFDEPQRALVLLQHSRTLIRDGLQEVRKSVQALRDHSTAVSVGKERWLQLIEAFAEATGIVIKAEITEDFTWLNPEIAEVVYRVIQEGLTNAYRHGHAKLVIARIWRHNGLLLIRVSDNGRGVQKLKEGCGISGMRERVEALGGRIAWRSEVNRGFDLGVEIPCGEDGYGNAQENSDSR
ncbi:MAG: sensor histidine kinase [Firmicutes bacterium]|nr:sensor histidine kinase [Bacillota bacterium]